MARNPELDHEYREGKTQQKPYVFTFGDLNTPVRGAAPEKMTDPNQIGEATVHGSARSELPAWQRLLIGVAAVVVGIAVITLFF